MSLCHLVSRRTTFAGLAALLLPGLVDARKKKRRKRKKHKKKQKVAFNAFGCVDVGNFCQSNEQCCSGICDGSTCQAHDTGGCQAVDDTCTSDQVVICPDVFGGANKVLTLCFQTTGKAPFCGVRANTQCAACTKDADCVADFGAGAACVVCADECVDGNHTTCLPPRKTS
jgi:hypothetical protein